jgi:molybdate-binding protein
LVLRPELADGVGGVIDVARRGLRLVNREPAAEARSVLDRELAVEWIEGDQLPGYATRVTGAPTGGLGDRDRSAGCGGGE